MKTLRRYRLFLSLLIVLFLLVSGGCIPRITLLSLPFRIAPTLTKLSNGLTVILKESHTANVVAIQCWVKVGSRDEEDSNAGISHFVEHMLFKGTEKRKVGEIDREIESVGGEINAATSKDFTYYHLVLASEYLDLGIEILADALKNSSFDKEELEKERRVILEEIRRQEDNHSAYLWNLFNGALYQKHPYRRPVIGYQETIEKLSREEIIRFYKKYYVPNNMTLVLVGDFQEKETLKKIERAFGDFKSQALPPRSTWEEPKLESPRKIIETREVKKTYLMFGFFAPGVKDKDTYAMDIIATVLGDGRTSRLYQELKEKEKLVYDIDVFYRTQPDPGAFVVVANLEEANLENCEQAILRELEKMKRELITEEELKKAKRMIESSYAFSNETSENQAFSFGYAETIDSLNFELTYLERMRSVTREEVRRVANRFFSDQNYVMAALKPKKP